MGSARTIRDLIELGRLRFLAGGILLYLFGMQLGIASSSSPSLGRIILGYVIVFGAHLSVSYSNDYFDFAGDEHGDPTPFSGGSGVLQRRPELRPAARTIALALIGISMTTAVIFTVIYSYPVWFLGVALVSNLLGWFYSAPPVRLTDTPAGELSTAFSVGLLVYFFGALVANPTLPRLVLLFAPAMFTSGLVFILTVQIPDLEADSSAGKPTWVRSLGRRKAFAAILVLTLADAIYYIALALLTDVAALDFRIVALISLAPIIPAAIAVIQRVESAKRATRFVGAVMAASIFVTVCFNAYLLILRMV